MSTQITVREVNEHIFQEFKAQAVRKGLTLGAALDLAMEQFLQDKETKQFLFTTLKPISWGKGTEKTSEDVDRILAGK